jgi:poly(glycerol-phosphate) alpha-glucosyltransferase
MLDPWAVKNSAWKKKIVGFLYENKHLRQAACIHALCMSEYEAVRAFGLKNPVAVIPNGVDLPELEEKHPEVDWFQNIKDGKKVLLFLGRLHPKKGLVNLLHGWAKAEKLAPGKTKPWQLVIAGWEQGGHRAELERLAADLGVEHDVHCIGPQFDEQKQATLARADAFVLPSLSEGLPMAVLEAWSYGLPVVMTRQCNLPEGFACGAALETEPEPDRIAESLLDLFSMSDTERTAMGRQGRELVKENYSWDRIGHEMAAVYKWMLGGGVAPSCVVME